MKTTGQKYAWLAKNHWSDSEPFYIEYEVKGKEIESKVRKKTEK